MFAEKIRKKIKKKITKSIAGKTGLQPFFEALHEFSLAGMNLGGGDSVQYSGEKNVIGYLAEHIGKGVRPVVFDIGANVGAYASEVISVFGEDAQLYCFEPLRKAYAALNAAVAGRKNVRTYDFGFGEKDEAVTLYSDSGDSMLASCYPRRMDHLGVDMKHTEIIALRRLDDFCGESGIGHIHLLKLDVEGGELGVLKGASSLIASNAIDLIQFEFGACNIGSRTFFQDYFYLLNPRYRIHRVLKDGFAPVDTYKEAYEVFITTNYLAVSRKSLTKER